MATYSYENLTLEMLESAMRDLFKQKSIETMSENKLDVQITNTSSYYGNSRIYRYIIGGDSALRFDQIPYPECCGIAIIKNFSCNGDLSKADFTEAMTKFTEDLIANDRFSKVLFYTNRGSNGDRYFQQFDGITILDSFQNRRSGNMLVGFEIDLLKFQPITKKITSFFDEDDNFGELTEGDDAVASDLDLEIRLADQRLAEHRARLNAERRGEGGAILHPLRSTQSSVAGQYGLDTGDNLPDRPLSTSDGLIAAIERNPATLKWRGSGRTLSGDNSRAKIEAEATIHSGSWEITNSSRIQSEPIDMRDIKF